MHDAIVVGAGIFGCTIARALRDVGRDVAVIDSRESLAGSQASGNLMKPGWFAGLGRGVYEPSLALLDRLYGLRDLEFHAGKAGVRKQVRVHHVPTSEVLAEERTRGKVVSVAQGSVSAIMGRTCAETVEAPLIVVAAGYWCGRLVPGLEVVGKHGISFRWRGKLLDRNLITPWAPYKQVVSFMEDETTVWAGDGSAILVKNWTTEREQQCRERVQRHVGLSGALGIRGIRPLVKGAKPCYLEEVRPGVWCATGGAKNGLVAAGWCAHRILEATS